VSQPTYAQALAAIVTPWQRALALVVSGASEDEAVKLLCETHPHLEGFTAGMLVAAARSKVIEASLERAA